MSLLVETDEVLVFAVHQLNHPAAIIARRSSAHRTHHLTLDLRPVGRRWRLLQKLAEDEVETQPG